MWRYRELIYSGLTPFQKECGHSLAQSGVLETSCPPERRASTRRRLPRLANDAEAVDNRVLGACYLKHLWYFGRRMFFGVENGRSKKETINPQALYGSRRKVASAALEGANASNENREADEKVGRITETKSAEIGYWSGPSTLSKILPQFTLPFVWRA